jgi:hypothetical protein
MSDFLAIAAVTTTLRNLLDQGLNTDMAGTTVTTRPLDRARDGVTGSQVNLFLYHSLPNATWRNMEIPWKRGGQPPLALSLYYLITAFFGDNEDSVDTTTDASRILGCHRLLGRAMAILHDHPLLDAQEINNTLPGLDRLEHPYDQVERVRLTPQPLNLEEMFKLWSGFQTEYRLSAAYEAGLVLIESELPKRSPLPVLRRGFDDRGAFVLPGPAPTLTSLRLPFNKPAAELGDTLTLLGGNLEFAGVVALLQHPLLDSPIEIIPQPGAPAGELWVTLPDMTADPNAPANFPGGVYLVSLRVARPGLPAWVSNNLPFALAPQIGLTAPAGGTAPAGDITVELECIPQVQAEQRVSLIFGDREGQLNNISTPADPTQPSTLSFTVFGVAAGEYVLRLRLDGVDSIPVDFSSTPPAFAADQKVTVT